MINVFSKNLNTIGNLAIVLLFLGGCVFMFTGSWNASETEAASCCGTTSDALAAGDCDTCVAGGATGCTVCDVKNACGPADQPGCPDGNVCYNAEKGCRGSCDGKICKDASQCDGQCSGDDSGGNNC